MTGSEWTEIAPGAAGFSPALGRKLHAGFESGLLPGLHAVAMSRKGDLAFEEYFAGHDEAILRDLGHVDFAPETLHDVRSITKSIVGILYGIALDRGLVPALEAPLVDSFPEYPDLAADPERRKRTIRHALTMTLGLEWDESKPYTSVENSEIAMECAPDRYRFVLERPIVGPPGESWIYCGGAVALIGAIIERGTGMALPAFAAEALFAPLGITTSEWFKGEDGVYSAAAGLRLGTRDLLRIGAMLLDGGRFNGTQIVSEAWLAAAFQPRVGIPNGPEHYGYLWFIGEVEVPTLGGPRRTIGGYGNGGQRLLLLPDAALACVILCGNYNAPDSWVTPSRVAREIILANLERA